MDGRSDGSDRARKPRWVDSPLRRAVTGGFSRNNRRPAGSEGRVRHARSHRSSRNGGGVMEDLLRSTRDIVTGTLLESVKDAAREMLRRSLTVTLLYVVAAVLLGTGSILMLIGGFEALRLLSLPD